MSTKPHQRVFALTAAILFLVSSLAFSGYVIWQLASQNDQPTDPTTQINEQQDLPGCQLDQSAGEAKAEPEAFIPEGDVTELQVTDLTVGSGAEVKAGDCLLVKYHGTLATTGEKFDGNFDQPMLLKVPIGEGQVIPGWDQGLIGMKVGGTRRLVIPSELAYGEQESGTIPANSDLVFVVELYEIEVQE